jgi:hypothetical protein
MAPVKRTASKRSSSKPKKTPSAKKASLKHVTGKPIARLSNGIFVVQIPHHGSKPTLRSSDTAGVLLDKLGKALSKPGLSRGAVFGNSPSKYVYSYYVDENNPTKMIRESFDGKRKTGRVVDGKFRAD